MTTQKSEDARSGRAGFGGLFVSLDRKPQLVIAACLLALAIMAVGVILYFARAYALPLMAAFVLSVVLAPLCGRLEWFRLPTAIAALLALALASGVVYAGFAFIARPAATWIDKAPESLQKAERQLRKLREPFKTVQDISNEVEGFSIAPAAPNARPVVVQGPKLTDSLIASAQVIVVQAAFALVLTYFFLLTRKELRLKIISLQTRVWNGVRAARIFRDVERGVSGYFVTFSLINMAAGIAVGVACWQLGLPDPAMWGGIAALLNFIPFVGPAITIALLALAGLSTFDTLIEASWPVLAYLGISFVESNIVTPTIMSRRMTLNPLAIILAVSFWTWIWGPVGALLALPLLIMLKVVCDHTPALRPVGTLIGGPLERGRRRRRAERADAIAKEQLAKEEAAPLSIEESTEADPPPVAA
jgi:predicted PurR-regulated permease PerM